ncbi:hypothetical protein YC2023_024907 [Brassica napus]
MHILTYTYIHMHTYIHSYAYIHTYIHMHTLYIHTYIHSKRSQQDQWLLPLLIAVVRQIKGQMFVKETSCDNCTTGCDDSTIKYSHGKSSSYGASARSSRSPCRRFGIR